MPDTHAADLHAASALPLSRIVVLDLTLARAGPTCVRHLGDWGADVIRIEPPDQGGEDIAGNRDGFDFQNLHRNKRMVQLNLKSRDGHAAFMRLVETADVIVENMRANVKHRLGIDWETVHKVNPRLVYGSISGFGQTGPYSARAGVDQIAQGMGGLMSITGLPGQGPVRVGIPIADLTAGNLLAFGIMTALFERERTGVGRWVHTSLLEVQTFMLDFQAARWLRDGEVAGQAGNDHPTGIPTGVFPTADGHINIAASSGRLWPRFAAAAGHPEWATDPAWATQVQRSDARKDINATIAEVTRTQPSAHWIELFEEAGIPCGPINTIDQVFADPQVRHLGLAAPVEHRRLGQTHLVASPVNMSGIARGVRDRDAGEGGAHGVGADEPGIYGGRDRWAAGSGGVVGRGLLDRLSGAPSAGPRPLEVVAAQPAGDVHGLADHEQPGDGADRHGLGGEGPGVDSAQRDLGLRVALRARGRDGERVEAGAEGAQDAVGLFGHRQRREVDGEGGGQALGENLRQQRARLGFRAAALAVDQGGRGVQAGQQVDGGEFAGAQVGRDLQDGGAGEAAMGEQHRLAEASAAGAGDDGERHAAERAHQSEGVVGDGERDESGADCGQLQAEAGGDVVGEAGGAELGDREAAGREDEAGRLQWSGVGRQLEVV